MLRQVERNSYLLSSVTMVENAEKFATGFLDSHSK